jgi:hypothetical protein
MRIMTVQWVDEMELTGNDSPIEMTASQLREGFLAANMTMGQIVAFAKATGVSMFFAFMTAKKDTEKAG